MRGGDRLTRCFFPQKFSVLHLFRRIPLNTCNLLEYRVHVDCGHDGVNDKVTSVRKEVQSHNVSMSRAIRCTKSPSLQHYRYFGDTNVTQNSLDDVDPSGVYGIGGAYLRSKNERHGALTTPLLPRVYRIEGNVATMKAGGGRCSALR